jgi:TRAP-type C4-dicarboxylate transport system permease small subunit
LSSAFAAGFERLSFNVNRVVEVAVGLLAALTVIITFIQVVFRYGLDSSLSWSEEAARYCFIWTIFLGVSVAARRGQHIVVDIVVEAFPRPVRRVLALGTLLVGIAFFAVFAYVASLLVENAWLQTSTALGISIAWVYACAPIGAVLTILHLVNVAVQPTRRAADAALPEPGA